MNYLSQNHYEAMRPMNGLNEAPIWMGNNRQGLALIRRSWYGQEDNLSAGVQEKEITNYCRARGIELVKIENMIESAKDSDFRKKFHAAVEWALKNKIRHLLYYMTDREVRNFTDLEKMEKLILSDRIVVHYVRDNRQLHKWSPPSDFSHREIDAWRDKQLSRTISVKVNDAMRDKAEKGWFPSNHVPLGYALKKQLDEDGREKKRGGIIVPDPNKKKVLQAQLEFEYRAKGLSYEDIRQRIISHTERLLTPEQAKTYYVAAIERRIKNPFYGGTFHWQGIEYKGKHELIIPPKIHAAALATCRGFKNVRHHYGIDHGHFGAGWMTCAECGCYISYEPKEKVTTTGKKTTFHYYHCTNRKKFHVSMRGLNIREEEMWEQLDQVVEAINITPKLAKEIAAELNTGHKKAVASGNRRINDLRDKIRTLEKNEDQAYENMVAGLLDGEGFKRQVARFRDERKRMENEILNVEEQMKGHYRETALSVLELAKDAKSLYKSQNPEERAKFIKRLCQNPQMEGRTLRFSLRKPFDTLAKIAVNENWRPLVEEFRTNSSEVHGGPSL